MTWVIRHRIVIAFITLFSFWGFYSILWGEKITVNQGLGWDGKMYASMTKSFGDYVSQGTLDRYYFKRLLPCGIVHYGHRLLNIDFSISSVVRGFSILNLSLILLSMVIWNATLNHFQLKSRTKVLGFSALFISYALIKMPFYYPILTDTFAFILSLCLLWSFLKNNTILLATFTILGAFTFPTLFLIGSLLLVFPFERRLKEINSSPNYQLGLLIAVSFILLFLLSFSLFPNHERPSPIALLAPSLLISGIFLGLFASRFSWETLKHTIKEVNRISLAVVLTSLLLINAVVYSLAAARGHNILDFGISFLNRTSFYPMGFLVSHTVYYGPVVLLFLLFHKSFSSALFKQPLAFVIIVFGFGLFAINPVSRQLICSLPFLLIILLRSLSNRKLSSLALASFIGISIFFSKFWFEMNTEVFTGDYLSMPDQRYFMSDGQYMSLASYLIQLCLILVAGFILKGVFKLSPKSS